MLEKVIRVILAYKRRVKKVLKKRSPVARFKARLYYRKHKALQKIRRKKYVNRNKIFLKSRKKFKRTVPHWKHPPKPHYKKPKKPTVKKFHVPHRKIKKP